MTVIESVHMRLFEFPSRHALCKEDIKFLEGPVCSVSLMMVRVSWISRRLYTYSGFQVT